MLILRLLLHGTCIWLRAAALHDELSKLTGRTLHLFTAGCRHRCGDKAQVSLRKLHWMLGIDDFCSCVLSSHVFLVLLVAVCGALLYMSFAMCFTSGHENNVSCREP